MRPLAYCKCPYWYSSSCVACAILFLSKLNFGSMNWGLRMSSESAMGDGHKALDRFRPSLLRGNTLCPVSGIVSAGCIDVRKVFSAPRVLPARLI